MNPEKCGRIFVLLVVIVFHLILGLGISIFFNLDSGFAFVSGFVFAFLGFCVSVQVLSILNRSR